MSYASRLEARIAKETTAAIVRFGLIEDGDRIMVGLSGGKDSWTLMQILDVLRRRAPIVFSLVGVHIDPGDEGDRRDRIAGACAARGWECRIERTTIRRTMDGLLEPDATPCSLCARLRRGALYRLADEAGATKIALGHHADDFIETLLLNLLFEGSLRAMPARLVADDGRHVVIRPLVHVVEDDCRAYARASGLPIIGSSCPAATDGSLERHRVKHLLADLERDHPGVKRSMIRALGNVSPGHLLDGRVRTSAPSRGARAEQAGPRAAAPQAPARLAGLPGP
jgi:tRNA 2-thiocytidine biosynthesis protein TtcA